MNSLSNILYTNYDDDNDGESDDDGGDDDDDSGGDDDGDGGGGGDDDDGDDGHNNAISCISIQSEINEMDSDAAFQVLIGILQRRIELDKEVI